MVIVGGLVHRQNIFNRCIGLQVVAGGQNIATAIASQVLDQPVDFLADFFDGPKGQGILVIHAAMKTQILTILRLKIGQVPISAAPLQRVHDLNAHFNQGGQERA